MSNTRIDTDPLPNPGGLTLTDVRDWLRWNAPSIQHRRNCGDKLALRLEFAYRTWYEHKLDVRLQNDLLAVVREYMIRNLTESDRAELERKYGPQQ